MADLEPRSIDNVRHSAYGSVFHPNNLITAQHGANNIWPRGFYTYGGEIIDDVLDKIRREAESCDCLQGFQLCHSLGGGTGSGFGSRVLSSLREEYPDRMISTYSVVPSAKSSDVVLEPYNTTLSLHHLMENADECFLFDNEALRGICEETLRIEDPSNDDYNKLIVDVMSGITCSLRFPGQLNWDLRKLAYNLIPFPRLHFFAVGHAPLTSKSSKQYERATVPTVSHQMLERKNMMCAIDPRKGCYLTAAALYRGKLSTKEVDDEVKKMQVKNPDLFVQWIPNNVISSMCDVPHKGRELSATFIGNTTAMQYLFSRLASQFGRMYRRGAYLQWYIDEGMDLGEINNAFEHVKDVIAEYDQYQNANDYQVVTDHKNRPYELSPPAPKDDDEEKEGNEKNEKEKVEVNAEYEDVVDENSGENQKNET